jgi:3-oxoacyl-[acyl-carrier protein] reductase
LEGGEGVTMSLLNHPFDPEHDAAVVTGAGNGIGRAIAQALVAEGVRTVFADVREDAVADAVASSARPDLAVSDETWQAMRAVNVDAGFHLARELARTLIAARAPGSFLMLTSLHADTPRNLPHYSTSKAALAMVVKEWPGRWAAMASA